MTQSQFPGSHIWSNVPNPVPVPDVHHLKRQIRYVHLNPCRSGLVVDPLEWEWSTHRDVTDCVAAPWPDLEALGMIFAVRRASLGFAVHTYVSGDPSVDVRGTPMVQNPDLSGVIQGDAGIVLHAAAVALRKNPEAHRGEVRTLAVQTFHALRLTPTPAALKTLNVSRRTWTRLISQEPRRPAVRAALSILCDLRCRPGRTQAERK